MLFGKKRPEGESIMHYDGLPGYQQDAPCFLSAGTDALHFCTIKGNAVTLPLHKVVAVEVLPEPNYMLKYHNTNTATAKVGAKWYGVISYNTVEGQKQIAFWYTSVKISKTLYALADRLGAAGGGAVL